MTCSPARLAANRANAALSTGPRSEEGKARSRSNAMKHGLAAEVLRTPDEQRGLDEAMPPGKADAAKPLESWLQAEAAVLAMRIDRAREVEGRERERAALRATTCWDDDRRDEAGRIALGLARRPDRVVARLRGTVQGCEWMIGSWRLLLAAAGQEGGWTAEQRALASDLQGTPEAFRPAKHDEAGQAETAARMLAELEARRDRLGRSDAFERESAERRLDDGASPGLRRAIRYEADLHRRLRWCLGQLRGGTVPAPVAPPRPASPPPPRPAPAPPMADDLGLDLDPDEDFSDLDALFGGPLPPHPALARHGLIPVSMAPRPSGR